MDARLHPPLVVETYRRALRGLASTVCIVSARHRDSNVGLTVTAVSSVSMDPPSLLVAVNKTSSAHEALAASGRFCVNVLDAGQEDQSRRFSTGTAMEERFETGDWRLAPDGLPYLADAQANVFCKTDRMVEYGTHTLFIGRVESVAATGGASPLLYIDGRYASLHRAPAATVPRAA